MKYRKKPVVVEASPWWRAGDHPAVVSPVPAEVPIPGDGTGNEPATVRARLGAIRTLEGWMLVTPGDYVIEGVHGEHYACKPEIFLKTYEPVERSE